MRPYTSLSISQILNKTLFLYKASVAGSVNRHIHWDPLEAHSRAFGNAVGDQILPDRNLLDQTLWNKKSNISDGNINEYISNVLISPSNRVSFKTIKHNKQYLSILKTATKGTYRKELPQVCLLSEKQADSSSLYHPTWFLEYVYIGLNRTLNDNTKAW